MIDTTVGITPERLAEIFNTEGNFALVSSNKFSDEEVMETPCYSMTVRQLTQTHNGKTIQPKAKLVLTFARSALQDSFETMLGFRVGESALPVIERANALRQEQSAEENVQVAAAQEAVEALMAREEFGVAKHALLDLKITWLSARPKLDDLFPASKAITEVTIYEATEERIASGFTAPEGGMFSGDDIAECFRLAKEKELPKLKGVLLASVTDGVGSLTIPRKGKKATAGGPRKPKFTIKDYAKLAGYGDSPHKETGYLPPHKGFEIIVERDQRTKEQKKKGSGIDPINVSFTHELTIDTVDGKVCMNIYTTRGDNVKVPTVRFTEGRKTDLLVTEDLVEISPVSKLYGPQIGHTGGRTPATEWDLPAKLAKITGAVETPAVETPKVSASDLLGDDA